MEGQREPNRIVSATQSFTTDLIPVAVARKAKDQDPEPLDPPNGSFYLSTELGSGLLYRFLAPTPLRYHLMQCMVNFTVTGASSGTRLYFTMPGRSSTVVRFADVHMSGTHYANVSTLVNANVEQEGDIALGAIITGAEPNDYAEVNFAMHRLGVTYTAVRTGMVRRRHKKVVDTPTNRIVRKKPR